MEAVTESLTFSHGKLLQGSFIVYIAGVEVPVTSVGIRMTVGGQEPTAVITLVPDPLITRLGSEDRLEVQVFYLDQFYPDIERRGKLSDFRILFEGEILSWSYTNSAQGLSISFKCGNFLRVLSDLQPVYLTGPESFAMNIAKDATGQTVEMATNSLTFPWSILFFGIDQTQDPNKLGPGTVKIRRPYDLIMNILDAVSGVDANARLGSVISPNFFGRYMRRTAFQSRFVPSPIIETELMSQEAEQGGIFPILKAIRDDGVITALSRGAMDLGQNAPIWVAIQNMFLQMYYETLAITSSPIAQVNREVGSPLNGSILGPPVFMSPVDADKAQQAPMAQAIAQQKHIDEAWRIAYTQAYHARIGGITLDDVGLAQAESAARQIGDTAATEAASKSTQQPVKPTQPNCLLNYITKPQWIFGVAPSCNVIFPSMISEMHFEEEYWAQPTRLYINDLTYAEFFNADSNLIMQLAAMRGGYPDQVQKELDKRYTTASMGANFDLAVSGRNFLVWPEEFYRGPRSSSIRMPKWFMMLSQYTQTQQTPDQLSAQTALDTVNKNSALGKVDSASIEDLKRQGKLDVKITNKEELAKLLKDQLGSLTDIQKSFRRAYARYEYYRQRGEQRIGAVMMIFNPYIVPGYPIVVFDSLAAGQHFIAYATDVKHELSTTGWSTTVSFICGQSLDEFLQELFDAKVGNTTEGRVPMPELGSAPPYPINEIRDVVQTLPRAEDYFSALFHQKRNYTGIKTAAFDVTKAINLVLPSGESVTFSDCVSNEKVQVAVSNKQNEIAKETVNIDKLVDDYEQSLRNMLTSTSGLHGTPVLGPVDEAYIKEQVDKYRKFQEQTVEDNRVVSQSTKPKNPILSDALQKYVGVRPSTDFELLFRDYYNAMRFISRPICTLEEYIAFRGSKGVRIGGVLPNDPTAGKGGFYYQQILNFKAGPGSPPQFDDENHLMSPLIADVPDTRIDWVTRLKAYREKAIYRKLGRRLDVPTGKL